MKAFASLLDRLTCTPARNGKLLLMRNYFAATPDPDRGYALAALSDGLPIAFPLRRVLSELGESRFDPELFRLSREDVGDTAETVALIWPGTTSAGEAPRLSEIVAALEAALGKKSVAPAARARKTPAKTAPSKKASAKSAPSARKTTATRKR